MVVENDWMEEARQQPRLANVDEDANKKNVYIRCFVSLLVVVYTTLGKQLIMVILDSRSSSHA